MDYYQIPSLSSVYLEDSYVLAIHEHDDRLVFDLDVVLTENHPFYNQPKEGEQYCYKRALLRFSGVSYIEWVHRRFVKFTDAAGESDYGNIDVFSKEGDCCALAGDWGEVKVKCSTIELTFVDYD
ncbi:MAG: hypothetical protein A3J24_00595 [Deltaproteobacteria bacterium RIFCSPLOWO2_02_FULL_53_8]|nr:MAG: hypothetical protein A3J24_00595 [Deltaproteobacteria bacterium RIFCSPLOWO2_02_FULL_53_8]